MDDRDTVLRCDSLGDQRPMASLGIALHAQQRGGAVRRKCPDQLAEVDGIEDLLGVTAHVPGGEVPA